MSCHIRTVQSFHFMSYHFFSFISFIIHSIPVRSAPFRSIPFHSMPFFIPFPYLPSFLHSFSSLPYPSLSFPSLSYPVLHSIPFPSIPFHSIPFPSIPPFSSFLHSLPFPFLPSLPSLIPVPSFPSLPFPSLPFLLSFPSLPFPSFLSIPFHPSFISFPAFLPSFPSLPYPILHSIPFRSVRLHSLPCIPFPCHPSIPFRSIPFLPSFRSVPFHAMPFHPIPCHSIPFHSIHSFIPSFLPALIHWFDHSSHLSPAMSCSLIVNLIIYAGYVSDTLPSRWVYLGDISPTWNKVYSPHKPPFGVRSSSLFTQVYDQSRFWTTMTWLLFPGVFRIQLTGQGFLPRFLWSDQANDHLGPHQPEGGSGRHSQTLTAPSSAPFQGLKLGNQEPSRKRIPTRARGDTGLEEKTLTALPKVLVLRRRNPAPRKKPWNDDSPVNTNKQWFPMVSKWCRISSIHSVNSLAHLARTLCQPQLEIGRFSAAAMPDFVFWSQQHPFGDQDKFTPVRESQSSINTSEIPTHHTLSLLAMLGNPGPTKITPAGLIVAESLDVNVIGVVT